jgi:spermidine/putrescine transport system ATP-binding protein
MANRIAIMSGGHVVQTGTPQEIYERPADRFVADFVGETNFLDGTIRRDGEGLVLDLPGATGPLPPPREATEGPVTIMVRPEFLQLHPIGSEGGLSGRVVNIAFLGNHSRITVTTAGGDVVALRPHGSGSNHGWAATLGEEACVWWPAEDAAVVGTGNSHGGDERGSRDG